jgi:GNAT superfamily N-acetyltransferase
MVTYLDSAQGITSAQLDGFFSHWFYQPTAEALLRVLHGSDHIVLAFDPEAERVIGYITAITDGVSCAFIPHLEVLESRRAEGIGAELVQRMVEKLRHLYAIDLMCDPELQPFYARYGFRPSTGMVIRNYDRQRLE